jgi:predicted Zn-dependent protease
MINPDQHNFLRLMAHTYLLYGKVHQAHSVLNFLSVFVPEEPWGHALLAYTYLRLGEASKALSSAQAALDCTKMNALPELRNVANIIKGEALWSVGEKSEARLLALETFRYLN